MSTITPQELEDLQRGIMRVPFDIIAEGPYLWEDFVGCKALNQAELAKWCGPVLDIDVWHRAAQIDFARSTVIGIATGPTTNGSSRIVSGVTFNGPASELTVETGELWRHYDKGKSMRPYQIVKFLNVGNAKITYRT